MGFIFTLVIIAIYFFYFHRDLMFKLGFSDRDEKLLFIGIFISVCIRYGVSFIESLLMGSIDIGALVILLINAYFVKSKYDSL